MTYSDPLMKVIEVKLVLGQEELYVVPEGLSHLLFALFLHRPHIEAALHLQEKERLAL